MCSACLQGDSLFVIMETEGGEGKTKEKMGKNIATVIHPLSQGDGKRNNDYHFVVGGKNFKYH